MTALHFKNLNFVCHNGAFIIEINKEGDVQPCCPDWCNKYNFGNIYRDDVENIINSESAKMFRKSILDGNYKFCNKDICLSHSIPKNEMSEICDEDGTIKKFPEVVRFAHDRTCNLRCITCRDSYISDLDKFEKLDNLIDTTFVPFITNAKVIHLNTNGEVFVSEHCKKLIRKIIEVNPQAKFNLTSNGVFFTEFNCKELLLENRLNNVDISLHASSEYTYNKITGTHSFNSHNFIKVLKNLEYLVSLSNNGKINSLSVIFVVHKYNYKEMISFMSLPIIKNNRNITVKFWEYRPWKTSEMSKEYEKVAVWLPKNKLYKDFKKVISNKIFETEQCVFPELFLKIRNEDDNFFKKILNFII